MASNTRTVLNSIDWAKFFLGQRPFVLGGANVLEPALTCANTVIQTIVQPPFKWRWNRASVAFQTLNPSLNWTASTAFTVGTRLRDSNGNMQTVTAATGNSGGTVPVWSTTVGGTTTDNSITWTMSLITDYVQAISNFGYIEKASVTTASGTVNEIPNLELPLTQDAGTGRANAIGVYLDDNSGNITFRFMPGQPDQVYTVNVIYQKKPALLTAITGANGTWPIPDEYGMVYNYGLLALFQMFADDARFPATNQKFIASLLAISEGLDEQQKAIFMEQWAGIVRSSGVSGAKTQQGTQFRGGE